MWWVWLLRSYISCECGPYGLKVSLGYLWSVELLHLPWWYCFLHQHNLLFVINLYVWFCVLVWVVDNDRIFRFKDYFWRDKFRGRNVWMNWREKCLEIPFLWDYEGIFHIGSHFGGCAPFNGTICASKSQANIDESNFSRWLTILFGLKSSNSGET